MNPCGPAVAPFPGARRRRSGATIFYEEPIYTSSVPSLGVGEINLDVQLGRSDMNLYTKVAPTNASSFSRSIRIKEPQLTARVPFVANAVRNPLDQTLRPMENLFSGELTATLQEQELGQQQRLQEGILYDTVQGSRPARRIKPKLSSRLPTREQIRRDKKAKKSKHKGSLESVKIKYPILSGEQILSANAQFLKKQTRR